MHKSETWKRARSALLLGVGAVSLYAFLPSLVAVASSWHALEHVEWPFALLVLVCEAASFVCLWQLDRIALRTRAWFPVAAAQMSGNVAGRLLPGGGATATAFSVSLLARAGIDTGEATAALGTSTLLQVGTTFALPVLALPAILGGAPVDHDLATAAYLGIARADELVARHGSLPVPMHLRNAPTGLMKRLGYGAGYEYPHDAPDRFVARANLPDELAGAALYQPTREGREAELADRLGAWRRRRAGSEDEP